MDEKASALNSSQIVQEAQQAARTKQKLKKLLVQLDQSKQGFIQIEAFFKMLELHEIQLPAQERQMLQKLCQTKASQIKYKDALALIHYNSGIEGSVGMPFSSRPKNSAWILQIPKKGGKPNKRASLNVDAQDDRSDLRLDAMTMVSNMTYQTDVSIDPAVRLKAERILEQAGGPSHQKLDVINEEMVQQSKQEPDSYGFATNGSRRLTEGKLKILQGIKDAEGEAAVKTLDRSKTDLKALDAFDKSLKERITKASRFSKFDERSLDQDDAYGNYRPKFQTKNKKVTGRTKEVMKLQRMASTDQQRALLGPVQPDLTTQKQSKKKAFQNMNQATAKHFEYQAAEEYSQDGTPLPQASSFFRKAEEIFLHDLPRPGQITDVEEYRQKLMQERQKEQPYALSIKSQISLEYLKQVVDTKKIDEPRQKLLLHLLNCRVDYRVLAQMKQYLFDRFPGDQDIPIESFKKEAQRYLHVYPQDIQDKIIADLSTDDTQQLISRQRLLELTEMYQYLPLKVKRDKNKSEDIYFIMNSNKRGAPQSKEQLLQELKDSNEKMYVAKIITLVAIKLEEKFHTMAKAFLFFDIDNHRRITRAEFAKGVDGLRVKLTKDDVDKVFDYLDKDGDQALDYQEFCGLSEEKRRNIDPFEIQHHSVTSLKPREVNIGHYVSLENSVSRVSADSQGSLADVIARRNASTNKYEDLESKAAQMNLINLKDTLRQRQISVPKKVMGNHNHTFGMKSTAHLGGLSQLNRSPSKAGSDTESHMKSIMQHTDNLREDLERKIQMKMQLDLLRKKQHKTVMERINGTKTSELRSQSVLANKALVDIADNLEQLKQQKGTKNDSSFADIEKEKYKLDRVLLLPPIEKVRSLGKSLNPSALASPYNVNMASQSLTQNRQSQPQLQHRVKQLNLNVPVLSQKHQSTQQALLTDRKLLSNAEIEHGIKKSIFDQLESRHSNKPSKLSSSVNVPLKNERVYQD